MKQPAHLELHGKRVWLEPLTAAHLDELSAFAFEPVLWRWTPNAITTGDELRNYIASALNDQAAGSALPFVIRLQEGNEVVGCTRYGNIVPADRRLEIGWTWIAPAWQRSFVNTETKLLLLSHAFEKLGMQRVELKTDALNEKSRTAILRLGAKEEGILRKHVVTASGRVRDTVYYSILDGEWPAVRSNLERRLAS